MRRLLPPLLIGILLLAAAPAPLPVDDALIGSEALPQKLSEFRFFTARGTNARVAPYALTTPLFSDYADKDRFLYVPPGRHVRYADDGLPVFPVGSALIKTFRYGDRKVETRVLLHRANGWVALPYVWEGDDAVLRRAGRRIAMTVDVNGQGQQIDYAVPNVNQCKECHASDGKLMPIGPKARNLPSGDVAHWRKAGLMTGSAKAATLPVWGDTRAPLEARARAYLDVNCGHCHNPRGSASNSGLNLTWQTVNRTALGIGKTPVAAGRGSGGHLYAIDPGHPERSILVHRMASTEPGVAMPEVGRAMKHDDGVKLVSEWIAGMRD
jgi:uncharacterized repeat protein (TIGR03806 family)